MANQEISLKWNGYQSNILSNVKELYQDEKLADVTLVSDGQSFKAHKVILSANSAVFRSIFQQNPHKDPIIVLHDINIDSLRTLLTFMYNGEVNVTEEFLPVLLKTADTLRICGLSTSNTEHPRDEEKIPTTVKHAQPPKKRKKFETDENIPNKNKKSEPTPVKPVAVSKVAPTIKPTIIPKQEPDDSPDLTDYSGENTNDTDIALLDDNDKQYSSASPDDNSTKSLNTVSSKDNSLKKWISEVSSTQPGLNTPIDKKSGIEDDKECLEIDKEVETVLQSGTIVESLSITSESLNSVTSEVNCCKDSTTACYSNPSFPCPFCPRIYNSWGYRRRHVKSRHLTNRLSCKWCRSIQSSTGAWYTHATRAHGIPHEDARNSLVVMVEAHAVLTSNEPSVAQLLDQVGMAEDEK